jgi:hypothetical protein
MKINEIDTKLRRLEVIQEVLYNSERKKNSYEAIMMAGFSDQIIHEENLRINASYKSLRNFSENRFEQNNIGSLEFQNDIQLTTQQTGRLVTVSTIEGKFTSAEVFNSPAKDDKSRKLFQFAQRSNSNNASQLEEDIHDERE